MYMGRFVHVVIIQAATKNLTPWQLVSELKQHV